MLTESEYWLSVKRKEEWCLSLEVLKLFDNHPLVSFQKKVQARLAVLICSLGPMEL